ncbi:MAG: hypothetical protein Q7S22_00490 [Candidatus Micrarchaeota archaeon]|nr:hypothetical protein [Candidatus Micrarchaeota archaeon]
MQKLSFKRIGMATVAATSVGVLLAGYCALALNSSMERMRRSFAVRAVMAEAICNDGNALEFKEGRKMTKLTENDVTIVNGVKVTFKIGKREQFGNRNVTFTAYEPMTPHVKLERKLPECQLPNDPTPQRVGETITL